jgi:hypothetical protein
MKRLPLLLSIVALVIAVSALGLALSLRPAPLAVQRSTYSYNVEYDALNSTVLFQPIPSGPEVHLKAGDILEGYVSSKYSFVELYVGISFEGDNMTETGLGSGYGGTAFCYEATATGMYRLRVSLLNPSVVPQHHSSPLSETIPIVYWAQTDAG